MIIDNKIMLSLLDSADRARYYHLCADISLAGKDYKVNEIVFFAKDEIEPLSDYIQVKKYDDGFLLVGIYTQDASLILECMKYLDTLKDTFHEIELRTPFPSVLEQESITARFAFETPQYPANPVYYIKSPDALLNFASVDRISVTLIVDEDKLEVAQKVEKGLLDPESWGDGSFRFCTNFKDVKFYIMRVNGEIVGYLRAECGYMNIYDIGWLYIEPKYRGKGYATLLVLDFSKEMFKNGLIRFLQSVNFSSSGCKFSLQRLCWSSSF